MWGEREALRRDVGRERGSKEGCGETVKRVRGNGGMYWNMDGEYHINSQ
jgi:hypothetical protein